MLLTCFLGNAATSYTYSFWYFLTFINLNCSRLFQICLSLFFFLFSDFAILQFHVELKDPEGNIKIKSGLKIVAELKSKLKDTDDIIGLKLIDLDTLICQNDCSGHGKCRQETRSCVCESFWIENFIRRNLMDGKSNCGKTFFIFLIFRFKFLISY